MRNKINDQAAELLWNAGYPLEAGCLLYERLPPMQRPSWAVRLLNLCASLIPPIPEVEAVSEIARDLSRWWEAQDAFHATRGAVLREEQASHPNRLRELVLLLAENVAKVTYNAVLDLNPLQGVAPMPRFDRDAGWWIVRILRDIADLAPDPDFAGKAWVLACRRD